MKPFLHRYGAHCCAEQIDTTEGCPKITKYILIVYKIKTNKLSPKIIVKCK